MAEDALKQATCPICGYTDSATDAEALASSMEEHMRLTHNQVMAPDAANMDLKETGAQVGEGVEVGPGATQVTPPNLNAGNYGAFTSPKIVDVDVPERDNE